MDTVDISSVQERQTARARSIRRLLVSASLVAGLFTAACTVPSGDSTADDEAPPVPAIADSPESAFHGRIIKAYYGATLSVSEVIDCSEFNATTEHFHTPGCDVSVVFSNCRSEYSADDGGYVCTCEVNGVANGSGC